MFGQRRSKGLQRGTPARVVDVDDKNSAFRINVIFGNTPSRNARLETHTGRVINRVVTGVGFDRQLGDRKDAWQLIGLAEVVYHRPVRTGCT